MPSITPEESFLIQSYALAECFMNLAELEKNSASLIVDNANKIYGEFGQISVSLGAPVFQGQGMLVSFFYMLLVLPLEWKKKKVGDFEKFDFSKSEEIANAKVCVQFDSYCKRNIALTHLRNALAHGRLGFTQDQKLIVKDRMVEKGYVSEYEGEYSMESLGELAQSLNLAIRHYIETVINQRSN